MNNLFTSKGRVILFLVLVFQFGLKLQASANTRMVCDTDTTVTKKASNGRIIKSDTTLVLRAGSTIFKKLDTILIINGIISKMPAHVKKASAPAAAPDATVTTDAAAGAANTNIISAPPTDGTIQVKNLSTTPVNTTIVAPPTDGVIQVKDVGATSTSTAGAVTDNAAQGNGGAGATSKSTTGTPADNAAQGKNTSTTDAANGGQNTDPAAGGQAANKKADTATDEVTTLPKNNVIQGKNSDTSATGKTDTTLAKKGDTTIMKKADSVIMKRTDTTAMVTDTADSTAVKAKSYFLEVGGPGLAISANYDARFNKQRDGWGYRLGLGGFVAGANRVITIPFQINYLIGEHSSMFEVGAGTTFLNSTGNSSGKTWAFDKITGFIATGSIGYRYQPEHKGINFRLAFVPILYDEGIIPAGGISIGYTFK